MGISGGKTSFENGGLFSGEELVQKTCKKISANVKTFRERDENIFQETSGIPKLPNVTCRMYAPLSQVHSSRVFSSK